MSRDPLRHLATYPLVTACPFDCGEYLVPGELHACAPMNEPAALLPAWFERAVDWFAVLVITIAAIYLTAHILVAAGVACPGTN